MQQTREILDRQVGKRTYTDEGFLIVPSRIARTGIQDYLAYELGITDGDPMRVIKIYRSPEEVFSPDAMASFENKPVTDDHPTVFVDSSNWRDLSKGFSRNVRREGDYLMADLIIADKEAIDKVVGGKVELSNGYGANYDWTPGVTPSGEHYDGQQKNIRGNHVAIVDAARCGPVCRVSDNQPKGNTMADKKVTIDGIPFELPEAAAAAIDKLIVDRAAAQEASKKAGESLAAAQAAHDAQIKAKDEELAKAKKDAITPEQRDALVESWAALIGDAKRLVADFDHKGKTCDAIRREVIAKVHTDAKRKPIIDAVLAGKALESVDSESVKTIFAVLSASATDAPQTTDAKADPYTDAISKAMGDQQTTVDANGPVLVGRDALQARFAKMSAGG